MFFMNIPIATISTLLARINLFLFSYWLLTSLGFAELSQIVVLGWLGNAFGAFSFYISMFLVFLVSFAFGWLAHEWIGPHFPSFDEKHAIIVNSSLLVSLLAAVFWAWYSPVPKDPNVEMLLFMGFFLVIFLWQSIRLKFLS